MKQYTQQDIINMSKKESHEAFAEFVADRARQLNQRFYRLEKAGVGINDTAYRFAAIETGKEKPRFSTSANYYSKMSAAELEHEMIKINKKLTSDTSTIRGIKRVTDARLSGSAKALSDRLGRNVTEDEVKRFTESGGDELLNNSMLDSSQVFDDWLDNNVYGVTVDEFAEAFKTSKSKGQFDVGKATRALKNLRSQKLKKKVSNFKKRRK